MKKTGKLLAALITALSLAMPVNVWADTKISTVTTPRALNTLRIVGIVIL